MKWMIYFTFVAPLLITFLYVDQLAFSLLQSGLGMDHQVWQVIRIVPIVGYGVLRWALFRDEVQFQFD